MTAPAWSHIWKHPSLKKINKKVNPVFQHSFVFHGKLMEKVTWYYAEIYGLYLLDQGCHTHGLWAGSGFSVDHQASSLGLVGCHDHQWKGSKQGLCRYNPSSPYGHLISVATTRCTLPPNPRPMLPLDLPQLLLAPWLWPRRSIHGLYTVQGPEWIWHLCPRQRKNPSNDPSAHLGPASVWCMQCGTCYCWSKGECVMQVFGFDFVSSWVI